MLLISSASEKTSVRAATNFYMGITRSSCQQPAKHKQLFWLGSLSDVVQFGEVHWEVSAFQFESISIYKTNLLVCIFSETACSRNGMFTSWSSVEDLEEHHISFCCILGLRVGWWETFANLVEVDPTLPTLEYFQPLRRALYFDDISFVHSLSFSWAC